MIRFAIVIMVASVLPTSAATLGDLSWMEGHWRGEAFGGVVEEIWLPVEGDMMHGVFRAVADGKTNFSEYIQVTVEDGAVVMRFAHYRPDYSTWEGDGPPVEMRLETAAEGHARFVAMNDTSPDEIEYRILDDGRLEVHVTGLPAALVFAREE